MIEEFEEESSAQNDQGDQDNAAKKLAKLKYLLRTIEIQYETAERWLSANADTVRQGSQAAIKTIQPLFKLIEDPELLELETEFNEKLSSLRTIINQEAIKPETTAKTKEQDEAADESEEQDSLTGEDEEQNIGDEDEDDLNEQSTSLIKELLELIDLLEKLPEKRKNITELNQKYGIAPKTVLKAEIKETADQDQVEDEKEIEKPFSVEESQNQIWYKRLTKNIANVKKLEKSLQDINTVLSEEGFRNFLTKPYALIATIKDQVKINSSNPDEQKLRSKASKLEKMLEKTEAAFLIFQKKQQEKQQYNQLLEDLQKDDKTIQAAVKTVNDLLGAFNQSQSPIQDLLTPDAVAKDSLIEAFGKLNTLTTEVNTKHKKLLANTGKNFAELSTLRLTLEKTKKLLSPLFDQVTNFLTQSKLNIDKELEHILAGEPYPLTQEEFNALEQNYSALQTQYEELNAKCQAAKALAACAPENTATSGYVAEIEKLIADITKTQQRLTSRLSLFQSKIQPEIADSELSSSESVVPLKHKPVSGHAIEKVDESPNQVSSEVIPAFTKKEEIDGASLAEQLPSDVKAEDPSENSPTELKSTEKPSSVSPEIPSVALPPQLTAPEILPKPLSQTEPTQAKSNLETAPIEDDQITLKTEEADSSLKQSAPPIEDDLQQYKKQLQIELERSQSLVKELATLAKENRQKWAEKWKITKYFLKVVFGDDVENQNSITTLQALAQERVAKAEKALTAIDNDAPNKKEQFRSAVQNMHDAIEAYEKGAKKLPQGFQQDLVKKAEESWVPRFLLNAMYGNDIRQLVPYPVKANNYDSVASALTILAETDPSLNTPLYNISLEDDSLTPTKPVPAQRTAEKRSSEENRSLLTAWPVFFPSLLHSNETSAAPEEETTQVIEKDSVPFH